MHWNCRHLSAHLLASSPEPLNTTNAPRPLQLFLILNFVPVTLSPRYFSVPSYQSINLFTQQQTQVGITNEDDGHNASTNKYNELRWVNAQQIDNLKIFTHCQRLQAQRQVLHKQLLSCIIPLHLSMYEHHAAGPSRHLPTHPQVTAQPPAMMDCDDHGGTCPIGVVQHKAHTHN